MSKSFSSSGSRGSESDDGHNEAKNIEKAVSLNVVKERKTFGGGADGLKDMELSEFIELQNVLAELQKLDTDNDNNVTLTDLKQFASFYGKRQRKLTQSQKRANRWRALSVTTLAIGVLVAIAVFGLVVAGIELMKDF
eukprot:TRINITY_DN5319_c0_g1_i1.p1 TRINITY_DN5319_c0_g1~~TRINITY_DN5319_c0_g1_i1.p1  ORF type:complete len:138 (-),score=31.93 TRINITY_DN5319_c0_g1_i1:335-748(-)